MAVTPARTFEMKCVSPNELAAAPHFPDLAQKSVGETLASRAAAKDYDIPAKKHATLPKLHHRFAQQAGTVEQDCLGRQEFEGSAGFDR